ncbi:MAG: erythromycin esterase family protein [Flavobacteriales bacterium]|nr:erythromycin esterase family protein [Flavobacteriales bacterium]
MKNILTTLLALLALTTNAQDFNPKTISLPENVTVDDLSFLKDELKDVQVVMLGEGSHFDGNMFEMKTKVIQFLYKEMGFKTIAFESGVYDVWKAQQAIQSGGEVKKELIKSLYTIWARRSEFQNFVRFYDAYKDDLKLFGFDSQVSGVYGQNDLVYELYEFCHRNQLKLKLDKEDFALLMESMTQSSMFDEGDISYSKFKTSLDDLLNQFNTRREKEEYFYWRQILKSLLSLAKHYYIDEQRELSSFYGGKADNIRDEQMADNLLAYINTHPEEKIICWGANTHFVNDVSSIQASVIKEFVPMGSYVKSVLKEKVYSLATLTAADSIYLGGRWNKTPVKKNSFESSLKNKQQPHLFVSSKQSEMKKVQHTRLFSPIDFIEARLDLIHDGYLYLDKSKLATAISDNEDYTIGGKVDLVSSQVISSQKPNSDIDSFEKEEVIGTVALNEIIVIGKRATSQIVKKAIESLKSNYPTSPVSSKHYSKVLMTIDSTRCLELDFVADQYDGDYISRYRSSKRLTQVRWKVKNGYEPKELRNFYSLRYNNPVKNGTFLTMSKYKKFRFELDEIINYEGNEVYVISYTTQRNHFTYTGRQFLSDYRGKLYVNKRDYALLKIIQIWDFHDSQYEPAPLPFVTAKFVGNNDGFKITQEIIETNFKKLNDWYYITDSVITINGEILNDKNQTSNVFSNEIKSNWYDFDIESPTRIKLKKEQNLFDKVKYDKEFWDKFSYPEIKK